MSATPDSTLVNPEQLIADLQRQLAEREAELAEAQRNLNETMTARDEALAREAATAEVLQVINSSPGDLAPVFDAMLEKAIRLCEATYGGLQTFNGEFFNLVASRGGRRYDELASHLGPFRPERGSTVERLVQGEAVVHVLDLAADEQYTGGGPIRKTIVEIGGARTFLSIALRKDETLVGALHVYRQEVRPFSNKQIALLQNFAAQAVIAMENARLLGELRARTTDLEQSLGYQTATSDVLQVISRSTFDLQPVLDTLVETAARLCEADHANLFRREADGFRRAATFGLTPELREFLAGGRDVLSVDRGSIVGRVGLEEGVVHVYDVAADPEYKHFAPISLGGLRTSLGVPLFRAGEIV